LSWSGNRLMILNPVNTKEDFSDKWDDDKEPELYKHFKEFITHLDTQWQSLERNNGVVEEANILKGLFGEKAYLKGQNSQVNHIEKSRKSMKLGISANTGILTEVSNKSTKPIRENTFYGYE